MDIKKSKGFKERFSSKDTRETFIVRIKRVCHTKAGGRVWNYQAVALAGDKQGNLGWAKSKSEQVFKAKSKAINRAQRNMKRMVFDKEHSTFLRDATVKMGKGRFLIMKRQKEGMGLTANPIISKMLSLIGIENACVRTVNGPDVLTVLGTMCIFLRGF